jgi:hypothetical protein
MAKKRNLPIPMKPPEYVTREMLANLRDELEEYFVQTQETMHRAEKFLSRRDRVRDELDKVLARVDAMERSVNNMLGLLSLKQIPRHTSALHEPVTWSYFHSWIARINERLDKLEKRK